MQLEPLKVHGISFRVTDQERAFLVGKARTKHLSVAALVRLRLFYDMEGGSTHGRTNRTTKVFARPLR